MSSKYDSLFEDENDVFSGTPRSRYWDISKQITEDLRQDEFDILVEKIAAMEMLLSEHHEYEELDKVIKSYCANNLDKMDDLKKSVYLELAGQLIYRVAD